MNIFLESLLHKYFLQNKTWKCKFIFQNFLKRKFRKLIKNGLINLKEKSKIRKKYILGKQWNNSKHSEWWESMSQCQFSKKMKPQGITQFIPITCLQKRKGTRIKMKRKIVLMNNLTRKGQSHDQSLEKDERRRKSKNRERKVLKNNENLNNLSNRIFGSWR